MNPVRLVVEETGPSVTIRVVGESDRDFNGSFALQSSGNGNQSTQSSSAMFRAGERVTLSKVTLAGVGRWEAYLKVNPAEGGEYEERASGPS